MDTDIQVSVNHGCVVTKLFEYYALGFSQLMYSYSEIQLVITCGVIFLCFIIILMCVHALPACFSVYYLVASEARKGCWTLWN